MAGFSVALYESPGKGAPHLVVTINLDGKAEIAEQFDAATPIEQIADFAAQITAEAAARIQGELDELNNMGKPGKAP